MFMQYKKIVQDPNVYHLHAISLTIVTIYVYLYIHVAFLRGAIFVFYFSLKFPQTYYLNYELVLIHYVRSVAKYVLMLVNYL